MTAAGPSTAEDRLDGTRPVVVRTPAGTVAGRSEHGAAVFRGIPFAEAPVGALRFAPPVARRPWDGLLDAHEFGPASVQLVDPLSMVLPGAEHYYYRPATARFDEDCLRLNVWTPEDHDSEALPVIVWIHGGGFLTGSGGSDWFDGTRLATRERVVVVTVNYRLGLLGNLWLGDADPDATNLGTRDQIAALRWVQQSIAAFGGDPDRVTVMGQSAGGMAVAALLVAPEATGLFHAAIVHSGHLDMTVGPDQARERTALVLDALRIPLDGSTLSALRDLSLPRLLDAQRLLPIGSVAPTADGGVLPVHPLEALRAGASSDVPVLQGMTATENALFRLTGMPGLDGPLRSALLRLAGPGAAADAVEAALAEYRADCRDDDEAWDRITSDAGWLVPVDRMLSARAGSSAPTFAYEFGWRSPALGGAVGAAHEVDVPFAFDTLAAPGVDALLGAGVATDPGAVRLARAMSAAWAAFARTGVPAADDLPEWTPWTPTDRSTMWLDVAPALLHDPHPARLALWRDADAPNPLLG